MSDALEMSIPIPAHAAGHLERQGVRIAQKRAPSVISGQLRDELIRILATGDEENEGAFTVAVATQVEKFVAAAREILMTEKLAQNDLASLLGMRGNPLGMGAGPWPLGSPLGGGGFSPLGIPSALGGNNENFGVQVVREIVEAARASTESPAKLVEALAVARENGLPDAAAELERKLGISRPAPRGGLEEGATDGATQDPGGTP